MTETVTIIDYGSGNLKSAGQGGSSDSARETGTGCPKSVVTERSRTRPH